MPEDHADERADESRHKKSEYRDQQRNQRQAVALRPLILLRGIVGAQRFARGTTAEECAAPGAEEGPGSFSWEQRGQTIGRRKIKGERIKTGGKD